MRLHVEFIKDKGYFIYNKFALLKIKLFSIYNISSLSEWLNIKEKYLIRILKKYRAFISIDNEKYYFHDQKDCIEFLNSPELEPYIVMMELCEEQ